MNRTNAALYGSAALQKASIHSLSAGVALPNFRSAHVFATRQLIGRPQKAQRRANFVQVLYETSTNSAEFDAKANGTFCKRLHKAL
jgi:hypothetical protein